MSLLRTGGAVTGEAGPAGGFTVKEIAETLCAPGRDSGYRVRASLDAFERRGLVVRDGDLWRVRAVQAGPDPTSSVPDPAPPVTG
jgi:hypothetical protein